LAAPYLFGFVGNGLTRGIALALPSSKVRNLLPAGLELGNQNVSPRGTHPLVFLCHDFSECQFSFPNPMRSMNFHEQTVGIPFTFIPEGACAPAARGPYYFMPKLYLDDLWVWMNGTYWWGFNKEIAIIDENSSRYTVTSTNGPRLLTLEWSIRGKRDHASIGYGGFAPVREILVKPSSALAPPPSDPSSRSPISTAGGPSRPCVRFFRSSTCRPNTCRASRADASPNPVSQQERSPMY
jgi:hypothetical protein